MSEQPYSNEALEAAVQATGWPSIDYADVVTWRRKRVSDELAAAHDREALGLDASVCARTFLDEIVGTLRSLSAETILETCDGLFVGGTGKAFAALLLRGFEANGGRP